MATQDSTPERTYCVYRIVCFPTGKVYVGQTNDPRRRKTEHFKMLKRQEHNSVYLQRAYNKYGKQAFYFEVLEQELSFDEANERECYWIEAFNSYHDGFNCTKGGDNREHLGNPCNWNGITYRSITDAAKANGVSVTTMCWRLDNGYSCDDELQPHLVPCEWNGVNYSSIADAATANNMHKDTMRYHILLGRTCNEDISKKGAQWAKECEWNGIVYISIAECARALGINRATLQERIEYGYKCDDDMPGIVKAVTWNGVEYPSITEAAKALNINMPTLHSRIKRGLTCDADMTSKEKSIAWNGIMYPSRTAAAKALGVHVQTIHHRIRCGYTCDDDLQK